MTVSPPAIGAARKSSRRVEIVDDIMSALCGDHIFQTLDYRRQSESELKQYMHQPLQAQVRTTCGRLYKGQSDKSIAAKAKSALFWERDVNTTINNIRFLGVQHRPDFVVKLEGIRVAVEVKRGESGAGVREGIGQALVYASSEDFDFVAYLFVDTSKDKKIRDSLLRPTEAAFVESLWERYNVRFRVV